MVALTHDGMFLGFTATGTVSAGVSQSITAMEGLLQMANTLRNVCSDART